MPCACNFSAVFAPTPQSRRTGSGCRNASSRSGGTRSSPSGLASWLATLARNLVRAMPTVIGSPTRSRTCARNLEAISTGVPDTRHRPDPQRRVVALFDRRVERIEVSVQDVRRTRHEHMFASSADRLGSLAVDAGNPDVLQGVQRRLFNYGRLLTRV